MLRFQRAGLLLLLAIFSGPLFADDSAPAPFRTSGGQLGFLISDTETPAHIRVMVDQDGPTRGWTEWGFDRMSEGLSVFRYPPGETTWRWESEGSVSFASRSNTLAMVLPNVEVNGAFTWLMEWFDDQWNVTRRFPAQGVQKDDTSKLAAAPIWLDPPVPDIAELMKYAPPTLMRGIRSNYFGSGWTRLAALPPLPTLSVPGANDPAKLVLKWTDARTGKTTALTPREADKKDNKTRWRGTAPDGAVWALVVEAVSDSEFEAVVIVRSKEEDCFRLSIGLAYPDVEWTWFDDVQFAKQIRAGSRYFFDAPSPYGMTQRRSYYPFGVIASTSAVLVAETDGREPRHFQIDADGRDSALWIHYDLATTPLTERFPNLAAVRTRFRVEPRTETNPFRNELASWYARDPAWTRARVPVHGLWMPFTDIGSVSNPADFGFAFFEKVGLLGNDVDAARANNALTLVYTEPWLYWLTLSNTNDWNRDGAMREMDRVARGGLGQAREFASAGLLGASRDTNQQPRLQFLVTPWSTGARMEVVTDPELPTNEVATVNRAMAEWRFIRESLEDPRVDGVYLDSISAMETMDYNPATLSVAEYPATFTQADLKPGVAMPIQAIKFTAALEGYLRAHDKYLMGNFPAWRFPFFMPYIDIPGEETTWYVGKRYAPLSERERNYRRAMSGAKPFGFLQATHFSELSSADIEKYFRDSLAQGFLPSFFSHDGANDPYWVDASLYERDRHLFRQYLPLTIRLSADGWQPVASARASDDTVLIEQFGPTAGDAFWLTLRNPSDQPISCSLNLKEGAGARVLYEVGTGRVYAPDADSATCELSGGAVGVWLAVRPEAVAGEVEWFKREEEKHAWYQAAALNLASYARAREAGIAIGLGEKTHASRGAPVMTMLSVAAKGEGAEFLGWLSGDTLTPSAIPCPPNTRVEITVPPTADIRAGEWTTLRWRMRVDAREHDFARMIRPPATEDLAWSGPSGRFISEDDVAQLRFTVSNRSANAQTVKLLWKGDVALGTAVVDLAPGEQADKIVSVAADGARSRRVVVQWSRKDRIEFESEVNVVFAAPLHHLGTKPGVRVTADSVFSGYSTAPLNDGVLETAGMIWYEAAFASAETAEPHWVRYQFPSETTVSSVTAHWNSEDGVVYASRRGEVWGRAKDGTWSKLAEYNGDSPAKFAKVQFAPVKVDAIEWRQPASSGSAARPDILWLLELEVE